MLLKSRMTEISSRYGVDKSAVKQVVERGEVEEYSQGSSY